jgi:DNA-binding transcriptional LysR family regulator
VGEVAVGSIMAPAPGLLTRTIIELRARYPLIKISVYVETSDVLMQMLEQGKLDIVLGRIPSGGEYADVNFEVVDNEALSVVAGVHHPLSQSRRLELRDLASQAWILQPSSSPMRQLLELAFQEASIASPANLVETASILTTTTLLQATDMISVVPTSVAKHYATSGMICILPVRIKLQLEPYGIITRKERIPGPAVSVFQECLRGLAVPMHLRRNDNQ